MDEPAESAPPLPAKPSKTPSWVMLGFILGTLFVWSLQRSPEAPLAPVLVEEKPPAPAGPPPPPRLMAIEAVFAEWGGPAVWENDTTEVALWSPETKKYSDCFEVIRSGENFYFRSIPRLTRPVLTHGVKENSLLQFTETPAQRDAWLHDVRNENLRSFSIHRDPVPMTNPPPSVRTTPAQPVTPPPPVEANPTAPAPRTGPGDGKP